MQHANHSEMALVYLAHLDSVRDMVRSVRFQVRPMNVGWSEKGMSFDSSQGMPSSWDIWLI